MSLKKLIMDKHNIAEGKAFVHVLLSGNIPPAVYYRYLTNQYHNYAALEDRLQKTDFPKDCWDVFRAKLIQADMQELEAEYGLHFAPHLLTPSTIEYTTYIKKLNKTELMAHMYVRYFGDMSGGAIIKKHIPGSGLFYEFKNKQTLKAKLTTLLDDDMGAEANRCFDFAIRLFTELEAG
ncbi:hypothetical protein TI05_03405 [Achromatium sp. WMS3]|nr:hypothetical protein TI05_03405 [Achromatium sp. WMS3]